MLTAIRAGVVYFLIVFGTGFVLGPIRILVLVPRFGERWAELMELPVMLVCIVVTARWLVQCFELGGKTRELLGAGVLAFGLLLAFEFTVVLALRGLTLAEYFETRDPVSGTVYYVSLLAFAVMPWIFGGLRWNRSN